ncbi:MAG: sulfatase-like hydrolase/transferase [Verrucomicrobiales bacterium]
MPIFRLIALLAFFIVAPVDGRPPNVVVTMADDLSYHDLSCYGHTEIRTPVIDSLAAEGVRLTSFYAGATICSPSRIALLTGAYPVRLGWKRGALGQETREAVNRA